jgi:hypothetical protein
MESVIVAIITSIFTLIGVIITSKANANKISKDMEVKLAVHQAVTDEKISELTREVREHNNFAKRMPVVENDIANIKDKIEYFHHT